MTDKSQEAAVS